MKPPREDHEPAAQREARRESLCAIPRNPTLVDPDDGLPVLIGEIGTSELTAAIVGNLAAYYTRFLDRMFDPFRADNPELTPEQFARWLTHLMADALLRVEGPRKAIEDAILEAYRTHREAIDSMNTDLGSDPDSI